MSEEPHLSEPVAPKTPESLKDDILGIKAIIESLEQEANKLENRRKQLASEIRHNDNILNVIYEDISRDNKAFLTLLQSAKSPLQPVTVSRNEAFVKRNFVKIKEGLEEKSINLDLGMPKSTRENTDHRSAATGKSGNDPKGDAVQRLDAENFYMYLKLTRGAAKGLSADLRALSAASLLDLEN